MTIPSDVLEAKSSLSRKLLPAGAKAKVVGKAAVMRVAVAAKVARTNVHAVGVGRKVVNGKATSTPCVRLYVVQKLAPSLLAKRDQLPRRIDGIPTDVIQSPPAFIAIDACSVARRNRQRPVIAGISTALRTVTAGTISCFCRSTRPGDANDRLYVLSNNHVFADVNRGAVGDALLQPGPADGGVNADRFADLHRFVPMRLGGAVPNGVDAAIGRLRAAVPSRRRICSVGSLTGTAQAVEGTRVRKHGRTTGFTRGVVTDESYDALVGMDHNDPSVVALFENQMRIEVIAPFPAFGLGGDSGSLIVTATGRRAVGLYFAGPESGFYGIANRIQDVLDQLEIALL
jgi:hypothetical protein